MKIARIEAILLRMPWSRVFSGALSAQKGDAFAIRDMESVIVKVFSDDGLFGLGEATLSWGGAKGSVIVRELQTYLGPSILGMDPFEIEAIMDRLDAMTLLEGRFPAKAALDIAVHDLIGKKIGLPLYRYFGGKYRDLIATTHVLSCRRPEQTAQEAADAVAKGCELLKIKTGTSDDLETLTAIRQRVGDSVRLRLDYNGFITPGEAISQIRRLEKRGFNLELIEQPAPMWDFFGLKRVSEAIETPILLHLPIMRMEDVANAIRSDCIDAASITLPGLGGIHRSRQAIFAFEAAGIPCLIGSFLEMGVISAAQIHLATALRNLKYPSDILGTFGYHEADILRTALDIKPGRARANDGPGLGIELNEEIISRYAVGNAVVIP